MNILRDITEQKLDATFVKELREYGRKMNKKEKTIHDEEKLWSPEVELKFIELV